VKRGGSVSDGSAGETPVPPLSVADASGSLLLIEFFCFLSSLSYLFHDIRVNLEKFGKSFLTFCMHLP